jgi:hypothetical protein
MSPESRDLNRETTELKEFLTELLERSSQDPLSREVLERLLDAARPSVTAFSLGLRFHIPSSSEETAIKCKDTEKGVHDLAFSFKECSASSLHVYCKRHGHSDCPACGKPWRS